MLAYGRGGALDTVLDGDTGLLFHAQTAEALAECIERFERELEPGLDPAHLAAHAARFGEATFRDRMWAAIRAAAPGLGLDETPPVVSA